MISRVLDELGLGQKRDTGSTEMLLCASMTPLRKEMEDTWPSPSTEGSEGSAGSPRAAPIGRGWGRMDGLKSAADSAEYSNMK